MSILQSGTLRDERQKVSVQLRICNFDWGERMIFTWIAFLYVLARIDAPLWVYVVFFIGVALYIAVGRAKDDG